MTLLIVALATYSIIHAKDMKGMDKNKKDITKNSNQQHIIQIKSKQKVNILNKH